MHGSISGMNTGHRFGSTLQRRYKLLLYIVGRIDGRTKCSPAQLGISGAILSNIRTLPHLMRAFDPRQLIEDDGCTGKNVDMEEGLLPLLRSSVANQGIINPTFLSRIGSSNLDSGLWARALCSLGDSLHATSQRRFVRYSIPDVWG
jgi:hypothetical protein